VWLFSGVYLGGDGREIFIHPLISGLRRAGGFSTEEDVGKSVLESYEAKQGRKGKDNR